MVSNSSIREEIELSISSKGDRSSKPLIRSKIQDISGEITQSYNLREDGEIESKLPQKSSLRGLFQGWKFTLFLAFTASAIVLFFNFAFLIFTAVRTQQRKDAALSRGDCERVHQLSTGYHWIINVLSTILLAASNFGMQCLVAPTRNDIDRAHKGQRWLDIGVPSIRNLFRISSTRSVLWLFLFFSSLPLHVFYNSAIFYQTAVPAYDIFAGPDSLDQLDWSEVHLSSPFDNSTLRASLNGIFRAAKNGSLEYLDSADCVTAFAQTYQTTYAKVLLVTQDDPKGLYTFIGSNGVYHPGASKLDNLYGAMSAYKWLCPANAREDDCSKSGSSVPYKLAKENNWKVSTARSQDFWDNWSPDEYTYSDWLSHDYGTYSAYLSDSSDVQSRVRYCLAQPAPQNCSLHYSVPLTVATVICNIVKTLVLLYIWLGIKEVPLLTIGDAIASFLRRQDPYSKGMCFPTTGTAVYIPATHSTPSSLHDPQFRRPVVFTKNRNRWGSAVSSRWGFFIFFWILAIMICILLLVLSILGITSRGLGQLGTISSDTILSVENSGESLVTTSLIANLPQLILSFLYVAYNSILTSMCLSAEWSRFGNDRKGLRVSHSPKQTQRSNYFLSIPYRFAIWLIVTSAILHWLASQSLFVIAIEAYNTQLQRDFANDVFACGYSPVAILSGVCIATAMFLGLMVISLRRFESEIPVASNCSIAIAAACHPFYNPNVNSVDPGVGGETQGTEDIESEQEEEDMALLPVKWGSIPVDGPVGHCSFSSVEVYPPEEGKEYQ